MVILIEGADNTGKSTLCESISIKYGYKYFHWGWVEETEKCGRELYKKVKECKDRGENVVLDRGYISNIIYSRLYKDTPEFSKELCDDFKEIIDKTVVCMPRDKEEYIERYEKEKNSRNDWYDEIEKVYDAYEEYIKENESETIIYNWKEMTLDETSKFISELVEE